MKNCSNLRIKIDLARVRRNVKDISTLARVDVLAVIKSDAYGLGAKAVAEAIGDIVQGFVVFNLIEATKIDLWNIAHKPILCIGPPQDWQADDFLAAHVHPSVSNKIDATRLRRASPLLCVDTGMQRFACPPAEVSEVLAAGDCREAFTHAVRPAQAIMLADLTAKHDRPIKLHAAGSSLLHDPTCRLNAVRPGLALYRGAVRVSTPLVETRDTVGPAGYTGFIAPRIGVILAGYSHGLRPGPCIVNGRRSRILEVGMQSAFVETQPHDKIGDEVILLGDGLEADQISSDWNASRQEVLVSLLQSHNP